MPDAYTKLRIGETSPVFGELPADSGTVTITALPTYVLKDAAGATVTGHSGNCTGYDTGALASPQCWINLNTTTATALVAGFYTVVFTILATGSDNIARVKPVNVVVQVVADTD